MRKFFPIIKLNRADFDKYLPLNVVVTLDDDDMERYARRIADAVMESGVYWDCIKMFSDEKKKELEEIWKDL